MERLTLKDGHTMSRKDYITAKTRVLIEFGYEDLTESDVSEQLNKIINKKPVSVIGMFMRGDLNQDA